MRARADQNRPLNYGTQLPQVAALTQPMLNLTRAEALIRPTQLGLHEQAAREFDRLGLRSVVLDDVVADRGRQLRADFGRSGFPLIDAVVVALGMELDCPVVTSDAKWPTIPDSSIEVLEPDQ